MAPADDPPFGGDTPESPALGADVGAATRVADIDAFIMVACAVVTKTS